MYGARTGKVHVLTGKNLVAHSPNCGCDFVRTVRYAPWITYNMMDGVLSCSKCGTTEFVPTPHVKASRFDMDDTEVYMDHEAIVDDLNRFKIKHQDCKGELLPESKLNPVVM